MNGKACDKCKEYKPDVKWAPDVKRWLCNWCWVNTPPWGTTKITER